jgi:hypothetical protein
MLLLRIFLNSKSKTTTSHYIKFVNENMFTHQNTTRTHKYGYY